MKSTVNRYLNSGWNFRRLVSYEVKEKDANSDSSQYWVIVYRTYLNS